MESIQLTVLRNEASLRLECLEPWQQEIVKKLETQISIDDPSSIMKFGSNLQFDISAKSKEILQNAITKDLTEAGDLINEVINQVESVQSAAEKVNQRTGIVGFINKHLSNVRRQIDFLKTQYSTVEKNFLRMEVELDKHYNQLIEDIEYNRSMGKATLTFIKNLQLHMVALMEVLDKAQKDLQILQQKAEESKSPVDLQAANQMQQYISQLDRRLADMNSTRTAAYNNALWHGIIINDDMKLSMSLWSAKTDLMPQWRAGAAQCIQLMHTESAAKAIDRLSKAANEQMQLNAQRLGQVTVAVAEQAEKGIFDLNALISSSQTLIKAMKDTQEIWRNGFKNRADKAEALKQLDDIRKAIILDMVEKNTTRIEIPSNA